jgi:hypothetical protein
MKPTMTIEELEQSERSILDLMSNPYCDHLMFMDLSDKLDKVRSEIEVLIKLK